MRDLVKILATGITMLLLLLVGFSAFSCDEASFTLNAETDNEDGTYTYNITLCIEFLGLEGSPDWFGIQPAGGTFASIDSYSPASITTGTSDLYTGEIVSSGTYLHWNTSETFPSHNNTLLCQTITMTTSGRASSFNISYHDTYGGACDDSYTLSATPPASIPRTCDFAGSISVSASGFETGAGFSQSYVLVEDESDVIVDIQAGGNFASVESGDYRIYAVNYEGSAPEVLAIDSLWNSVSNYDSDGSNCFATLGPKDGVVSVCDAVCYQDSSIRVSSSGYESGTGFSQEYVLLNENDTIRSSNVSGLFTFTEYQDSGVFQVYAVNTNDGAVTSEIDDLGPWSDVSGMESTACMKFIGPKMFVVTASVCQTPTSLGAIQLTGVVEDELNYLYWNSIYDDVAKTTELHRSASSGSGFETIQKFVGLANITEYEDDDYEVVAYYRIKQVLVSGKEVYSNVVHLERDNSPFRFTGIYPVPARNKVFINVESDRSYENRLRVLDIAGRLVYENSFDVVEGMNKKELDVSQYSSGVYYITVSNNRNRIARKIIIAH